MGSFILALGRPRLYEEGQNSHREVGAPCQQCPAPSPKLTSAGSLWKSHNAGMGLAKQNSILKAPPTGADDNPALPSMMLWVLQNTADPADEGPRKVNLRYSAIPAPYTAWRRLPMAPRHSPEGESLGFNITCTPNIGILKIR